MDGAWKGKSRRERRSGKDREESEHLGPLEGLFADPEVDQIMVNGVERIFVERRGDLELTDLKFSDEEQLISAIRGILAPSGAVIDEGSPLADVRLADGTRVNAVLPPLAVNGPALTVRKFIRTPFTADDLVAFGALSRNMAFFLKLAVEHRMNVFVSGGVGAGKTTLLNVLSAYIPGHERVITIEEAAELRFPHEHVVSLEARPPDVNGRGAIPAGKLVLNALRMRPDRIVVGECRGEVGRAILEAFSSGQEGLLATILGDTPRDALNRFERMALMGGAEQPSSDLREQIAAAVNVVIQLARYGDGRRRITRISEVTGMQGGAVALQDVFKFQQRGFGPKGEVVGDFMPAAAVPKFVHDLRSRGEEVDMSIFR